MSSNNWVIHFKEGQVFYHKYLCNLYRTFSKTSTNIVSGFVPLRDFTNN